MKLAPVVKVVTDQKSFNAAMAEVKQGTMRPVLFLLDPMQGKIDMGICPRLIEGDRPGARKMNEQARLAAWLNQGMISRVVIGDIAPGLHGHDWAMDIIGQCRRSGVKYSAPAGIIKSDESAFSVNVQRSTSDVQRFDPA